MKLSECKHGLIVRNIRTFMLGMIVGISENPQSEAIPIVQNQDGQTKPIHHSNLELYED